MRQLLELAKPAQMRRLVILTLLRTLAGFLDLAALALLWYTTTAVVSGSFSPLALFGLDLTSDLAVNEARLAWLGVSIVLLFTAKGVLGALLLKRLGVLTTEIEAEAARRTAHASLSSLGGSDTTARKDAVGATHAIESGSLWARGIVFGYSVAFSESLIAIGILVAMFIASPILSILLTLVLGGAAGTLNLYLTKRIKKLAKLQQDAAKEAKSDLAAGVSVKLQVHLRGLTDSWVDGIAAKVQMSSKGATAVYFLRSMPRYVMEIAILISLASVSLVSLLYGDLAANLPGAAVVLAGAFRIAGALLPLQGALNLVTNSTQLGRDFFNYIQGRNESWGEIPLRDSIAKAILEFVKSDNRVLILAGKSGIGKTTALAALLLESRDELGLPKRIGYGGQGARLLPGGAVRNLWLEFEGGELAGIEESLAGLIRELEMGEVLKRLESLNPTDLEVLSGGELTRLEILRAHLDRPEYVILDEPTSGLDEKLVSRLASYINASPSRYVVITHDKRFSDLLQKVSLVRLKAR